MEVLQKQPNLYIYKMVAYRPCYTLNIRILMAVCIPTTLPPTIKSRAEAILFNKLSTELDDDFTIIHSVPWLRLAVKKYFCTEKNKYINKKINERLNSSGEIDLVIFHKRYGLLCVEVKGGEYSVKDGSFFHIKEKFTIDPLTQVMDSTFYLLRLLQDNRNIRVPIGYCVILPDQSVDESKLPIGYKDFNSGAPINTIFGFNDMEFIGAHITNLMKAWYKSSGFIKEISDAEFNQIVEFLCPTQGITDNLPKKIVYDTDTWLKLHNEQIECLDKILANQKLITTGLAGTGKTIIACEAARRLSRLGKKILLISMNFLITQKISSMLNEEELIEVFSFHDFCRRANNQINNRYKNDDHLNIHEALSEAIQCGAIENYDVLIIDEAQAFTTEQHKILKNWFVSKPIYLFCDDTQRFSYETGTSLDNLKQIYESNIFRLCYVIRMPKAVTDRVIEIIPPDIQVISSRTDISKTYQSSFESHPYAIAYKIACNLVDNEKVNEDDIVILDKFGFNNLGRFHYYSIGKYRGMEAPIVILIINELLDNQTLACGFSRATTRLYVIHGFSCFVEAERSNNTSTYLGLKYTQHKQKIQKLDYLSDSPAFVKNQLSRFAELTPLPDLKNFSLSWAATWKMWVVENEEKEKWSPLLMDYFSFYLKHPVLICNNIDQRLYVTYACSDVEDYSSVIHVNRITKCEICNLNTPHDNKVICLCCSNSVSLNNQSLDLANLIKIDDIILNNDPKILSTCNDPIIGAIIHCTMLSKQGIEHSFLVSNKSYDFKTLCYFTFANAMACIQKGINITLLLLAGRSHEQYYSYLSEHEFKKLLGRVIGSFCAKGFLKKEKNGSYVLKIKF